MQEENSEGMLGDILESKELENSKRVAGRRIVILGINERISALLDLLLVDHTSILVIAEDISNFAKTLDREHLKVIEGDFLEPSILRKAALKRADSVVVLADTQRHKPQDADARSVVATLSVERINPDVKTVVEVFSDETAFHLHNANVDEIIRSGELTADILAFSTMHTNYSQHLGTLLRFAYKNRIVTAPVRERLVDKALSDVTALLVRERKIMLGVRIQGDRKKETLDPDYVLGLEDEIVYVDII